MEFNTELILSSDNISTSVILPLNNTSYSKILSSLKVWNTIALSRVYLLSNISSNIIFKSSFLKGCTIPRLDIRNSLLIKYYGVIPRLAYKLISIGKRFFFFNNKFLSMKK